MHIERSIFVLLILFTSNAWAYLDPASGSMLLTTLVSIVAGLYFLFKSFYYALVKKIASMFGKRIEQNKKNIIIYSEGPQYWLLFKPLLDGLSQKKIDTVYISSDKNDPGLKFESDYISTLFIGKGNKAYSYLSVAEAKIFVSTTHGLDVLQIKKSKGVDHYIHLIHAPSSLYKYKLYSLDYFDSVFVSGPHQIEDIRYLENIRNTKKKNIYKIGCLYYDEMHKQVSPKQKDDDITVLIAPSWDVNGLLSVYGSKLLIPLLEKGFKIILRPHPQSFIAEQSMLEEIKRDLSRYNNIEWDNDPSPIISMNKCDVMISDYSSVTMDYLFLFKQPLIVMKFDIEYCGFDGEDLKDGGLPHWEIEILKQVGKVCDNVDKLPQMVSLMHNNSTFIKKEIEDIIEASLYNFKIAKEPAIETVIDILNGIDHD